MLFLLIMTYDTVKVRGGIYGLPLSAGIPRFLVVIF